MDPPTGPSDDASSPLEAAGTASAQSLKALEQVRDARATLRRLVDVIETDGRYPVEAYIFLQEGLDFSVKHVHGPRSGRGGEPVAQATDLKSHPHHVDGKQLCRGLRELATRRWGRMAKAVLNCWGIHRTNDFGSMVFVLVDNQFLQKTDGDRTEDFADVFLFREFEASYEIQPGNVDAAEVHLKSTTKQ